MRNAHSQAASQSIRQAAAMLMSDAVPQHVATSEAQLAGKTAAVASKDKRVYQDLDKNSQDA